MGLKIVKVAKGDSEVLKNLMSMYLHDMSEFADFLKLSPDGSYKYHNLHFYWEKEELSAFFIIKDSKIIGFILSNLRPFIPEDCDISIQEFFILKKFRGKGYGLLAASMFFRKFPGRYFIAQLVNNKPAIEFWHSVYRALQLEYEEREEIESGAKILTQRFAI
ncbi:MAG: GNAT family N-acetyltransferase [Candidatus Zixiibacteriota bacterium]|nr:MAG: GNAT family N-acetyltransferase [candidate division Zixibacteria bacterium]